MSSSFVSMSMLPLTHNKLNHQSSIPFLKPLPIFPQSKRINVVKKVGRIDASLKEKTVTVLTAATVTVSMVMPEVANAAANDFSPSLKNFLLSIAAGGVVLTAIFVAVIGVSNFDPVKRT